MWATELERVHRGLRTERARAMAHAAFGLLNSTPHSGVIPDVQLHDLLREMALGALLPTGRRSR